MAFSRITSPAVEPLSLTEAKDHLRVSFSKEDGLINRLICGSRQAIQRETRLQLLTGSWKQFFDAFPQFDHERIRLGKAPLLSVTVVNYDDTSGVSQTWSAAEYNVEAFSGPDAERGVVFPKPDISYPQTRRIANAVIVDFNAGYGATADDVPCEIKQALLGWIGHHYDHRDVIVSPWPGFAPWWDADFG